jgi:hypothetical protein
MVTKFLAQDATAGRHMPNKVFLSISFVLASALLRTDAAAPQASSQSRQENQISTGQFKLLMQPRGFVLQIVFNGKIRQVAIPRDWLVPPEEEKYEESGNTYVSSFNYGRQVDSFPIGNGRIGLHLSSYEVAREGTSHAAAGRDVFLIFDPKALKIFQGGLRLGITKGRVRSEGCLSAEIEHYFIADVDGDSLTDIGVLREEFQCIDGAGPYGNMAGPFYKQHPLDWYLLSGDTWKLDPSFSGKLPERFQELSLMGIGRSPADVVGCGLSQSCDRAKWPHEIHAVTANGITAHFGGEVPAGDLPLRFGVQALWFTFKGDSENYGYPASGEDGELYFSDWSFDIFSPDGAYVLLLQDHYGPYYIIATDKLKDYLTRERKPDYVVTKAIGPNEPARVHHDGHWISRREVQFTVSCCGTSETITYTMPEK